MKDVISFLCSARFISSVVVIVFAAVFWLVLKSLLFLIRILSFTMINNAENG